MNKLTKDQDCEVCGDLCEEGEPLRVCDICGDEPLCGDCWTPSEVYQKDGCPICIEGEDADAT